MVYWVSTCSLNWEKIFDTMVTTPHIITYPMKFQESVHFSLLHHESLISWNFIGYVITCGGVTVVLNIFSLKRIGFNSKISFILIALMSSSKLLRKWVFEFKLCTLWVWTVEFYQIVEKILCHIYKLNFHHISTIVSVSLSCSFYI